ncbi:MAG: DUF4190 domain-containing protein [Nocardioidaceae bacterium]
MSYPPPPGDYQQQPMPPMPPRNDTKAIVSLVLGIVAVPALCLCGSSLLFGIAAIITGQMSKKSIDSSGGALTGRGMAVAGFVLGIVMTVITVLVVAFYAVLFATGQIDMDDLQSPPGTV